MVNRIENFKILRLDKELPLPKYETTHSAGMDLYCSEDVEIFSNAITIVPTGIAIALRPGYEAQIRPRSGLAAKHGITIVNSPGTIDADYRGEIKVLLTRIGQDTPKSIFLAKGSRIAQMVVSNIYNVEWEEVETGLELDATERGTGGFGSTGI